MTTKTYNVAKTIVQIIRNSLGVTSVNRYYPLWDSFSRTGNDRPKWRQQVKVGDSAVNIMDGSKYERKLGQLKPGSIYVLPTAGPLKNKITELSDSSPMAGSFYITNYPSASGASEIEANNRASAAIFSRIRKEMYQISGPTFLGELRQTLKMVRKPAAAFQDLSSKYMYQVEKNLNNIARKGGKSKLKAKEIREMLAGTWLEYSFGWSPLLSDIKNGAIAVARLADEPRSKRVSAIGVHELVTLDSVNNLGASQADFYTRWSVRDSHLIRVSYKVGLSASMTAPPDTAERLAELSGFQMQNFVPTVWELMPWSFLIDYFLNVNQVLEAYTTDLARVRWVSKCVYKGSVRKMSAYVDVAYNRTYWGDRFVAAGAQNCGTYQSEVSTVKRTASGITYPELRFQLPDLPRQVGNMAALLLTQGRIRKRDFS